MVWPFYFNNWPPIWCGSEWQSGKIYCHDYQAYMRHVYLEPTLSLTMRTEPPIFFFKLKNHLDQHHRWSSSLTLWLWNSSFEDNTWNFSYLPNDIDTWQYAQIGNQCMLNMLITYKNDHVSKWWLVSMSHAWGILLPTPTILGAVKSCPYDFHVDSY